MLKRWDTILNYIMGSFTGIFIGNSIYKYYDYKKHSDLYIIQSAPLYTSIQIQGLATSVIIVISIILKLIIRRKIRNNKL